MKKKLQKLIGLVHSIYMSKPLPTKVAIYFHQLDDPSYGLFVDTIKYLDGLGYEFVNNFGYANADPFKKVVNISFDDNYSNWLRAIPVFKKVNGVGVFYVNSEVLDVSASTELAKQYYKKINKNINQRPLTKCELLQLSDAGHEIGAHTHSHPNLAELNESDIDLELGQNIAELSAVIGQDIYSFSYPFGMPRNCPANIWSILTKHDIRYMAHGAPGMQFAGSSEAEIQRSVFRSSMSLEKNLKALSVDGKFFVNMFGLSPAEL